MSLSFRAIILLTALAQMLPVRAAPPNSAEANSNESPTVSERQSYKSGKSVIDEVTVVEKKSERQLRIELRRADDHVFELYNDLNPDDSLDMICKKEARIQSQIKYRVCKSAYHREMESEWAHDLLGEGGLPLRSGVHGGHYNKVRANMQQLMAEHPELLRAVHQRSLLRKSIAELKAAR